MNKILFAALLLIFSTASAAQQPDVFPPHWWTGMQQDSIQLLFKSNDGPIGQAQISASGSGLQVDRIYRFSNPNYVGVDVIIGPDATPGPFTFSLRTGKKTIKANWELKARRTSPKAQGVTSSDLIYLIMPDRFSNGDPSNDKVKGMKDQSLNRDSIFLRHGGDLQGIINHLDYLEALGVTTLWLMPVWENDMPQRSEHGYAITNHYKVDPRLGTSATYHQLADALHQRNMKLIQDAVYNHVGKFHFLAADPPDKNWLHQWPTYTNTTYKDAPLIDPYADSSDIKRVQDGWFTPFMPDLNQHNPHVQKFLIQHAIWSVEEFGVDGFRIDTYLYNDLTFMNKCNQALLDQYPTLSIFGETWVHGVVNQAYFCRNRLQTSFKSNLPGVTDFQTNMYGIVPAVNEPFGWTSGVNKLYLTLSNDLIYEDPMKNVVFLDNHDMTRFFSTVGEDVAKLKIGVAWLLTTRGIPQLYYGTEVLMKGVANPDGYVRLDFPGGWKNDTKNKFLAEGRSKEESEVFEWVSKLANFRKQSAALRTGTMTQFVPEDGFYIFFPVLSKTFRL